MYFLPGGHRGVRHELGDTKRRRSSAEPLRGEDEKVQPQSSLNGREAVDGSEIPNNHLGCMKPIYIHMYTYNEIYHLVIFSITKFSPVKSEVGRPFLGEAGTHTKRKVVLQSPTHKVRVVLLHSGKVT